MKPGLQRNTGLECQNPFPSRGLRRYRSYCGPSRREPKIPRAHSVDSLREAGYANRERLFDTEKRAWQERVREMRQRRRQVYAVILAIGSLSFVVPWGGVRAVAWVVEGFRQQSED